MPEEIYEYIRATVDCGDLTIRYQVKGNPSPGRMDHDEDVSDFTDDEIKDLIVMLLDVPDKQKDLIVIM